tara:strand:+ start:1787 stop:2011 length:225 start_codon:yes stop_codon:yes gene_type:complete
MTIEMIRLREYRNSLLADSDWTVMPDSPLSDSKKAEWKTYRQALRDITKTAKPKLGENSPFLDPSSVTFPTKPS